MIKKIQLTVDAAFCDECGEDLHSYEGWGYIHKGDKQYCEKCGLRVGAYDPLDYANDYNPTTRRYYKAELIGNVIHAYYKCKVKKGYRIDRIEVDL
jgi:hypothetical protein